MNKINLLTTVFIVLALVSCRKDDVFKEVDDPEFPDPDVQLVSSYTGFVQDVAGRGIQGALVIDESGNSYQTDDNGFFQVMQGNFSDAGSLFRVQKAGFIDAFRFVHLKVGQSAFAKVTLLERKPVGSVPSDQGGQLEIGSAGARITISANSVVRENGIAYSGAVQVYAHWYDPTDQNLASSMPGDLRGIDEDNEKVVLETYGMVSVELEGENGEKLNLQENTSATLTFPIAQEQASIAPDEIPLWSLEEGTGYWKEEGLAVREGDFYVAQVSHFSFWNCDWPYPLVEISGTVKDTEGNLLQNVEVSISINDGGTTCYGYTDARGYFEGLVPQDEMLTLKVYYENCEGLVFTQSIDPLSEDTNLGDIILELVGKEQITYSGSVFKCNPSGPVTNGYVTVKDADGILLSTSNIQANGTYSGTLTLCSSTDLIFQAVDLDDLTLSQEVYWQSTEVEFYEVENLNTCEGLGEYFIMTVDGETTSYTELIEGNTINNFFRIRYNVAAGNFADSQVFLDISDLSDIKVYSVLRDEDPFFFCTENCNGMVANISNYPSQVGEFIVGNVEGVIEFEGVTYEVKVDFRAQFDKEEYQVKIIGWFDENENGIFDSIAEPKYDGLDFVAIDNIEIDFMTAGSHNPYYFAFLPKGSTVDIKLNPNGFSLTQSNVDPSMLDNDFDQDGFIRNVVMDGPKQFYCGVIQGPLECEAYQNLTCGTPCMSVQISGGLPPYTIGVDGMQAPVIGTSHIFCAPAGNYDYVVTDANGEQCPGNITLENFDPVLVDLTEIVYRCENDQVRVDIMSDAHGGTAPYQYEWSLVGVGPVGSTANVVGLGPGLYLLDVTDSNDCTTQLPYEVVGSYVQIEGRVWDDNFGSISDEYESEQGIAGVAIRLLDADDITLQTIVTDADGVYKMQAFDLQMGDYKLELVSATFPSGLSLVDKDSASSDEVDSDADPTSARTDEFSVELCNIFDFDFGLK